MRLIGQGPIQTKCVKVNACALISPAYDVWHNETFFRPRSVAKAEDQVQLVAR